MKNIIYIILVFALNSCSSPNKIIENYILNDIKNDTIYKANVLIKEKTNFKYAFKTFQGPVKLLGVSVKDSLINDELLKKYSKNIAIKENWKKDDFKKIDFDIVDMDSLDIYFKKRQIKFDNKIEADRFNAFIVSELYYFNNNKNAFFSIEKFRLFEKKSNNAIILEKNNNKWVIIETRQDSDL